MSLQDKIDEARRRAGQEVEPRQSSSAKHLHDFVASVVVDHELQGNTIRDIFRPYLGCLIRINHGDPLDAEPAVLAATDQETFTVVAYPSGTRLNFPYRHVLSFAELRTASGGDESIVIEVYRQVFMKGSVGFGMSIPL